MPTKQKENKHSWKIVLTIGLVIVLIVGMSLLEFFSSQSSYVLSLYTILSGIIAGIWQAISTPTIAVAIMVFVILIWLKANLPYVLSMIEEIKAGEVSVKMDKQGILQKLLPQTKEQKPVSSENILSEKVIEKIARTLDKQLLGILIANDSITRESGKYLEIFKPLGDDYLEGGELESFTFGCSYILQNLDGLILTLEYKWSDSNNTAYVTYYLDPLARKIMVDVKEEYTAEYLQRKKEREKTTQEAK